MHPIKATWTNGQILPSEPVNWAEGSELLVKPVGPTERVGMDESEWGDDPESIAAWIAAVEKIQPLIWGDGEGEEYERFLRESRQFNIKAVQKQMDEMPAGDAS